LLWYQCENSFGFFVREKLRKLFGNVNKEVWIFIREKFKKLFGNVKKEIWLFLEREKKWESKSDENQKNRQKGFASA
jgi:hypothetical protein